MTVDDKMRRNIFYTVLGLTLVVLIFTGKVATEQDREAYLQYQQFEQARQFVQEGKYDQAASLLKELMPDNPSSYQIPWYYGVCLGKTGHYKEAEGYLERAAKRSPQLYFTQSYLFFRGFVLLNMGNKGEARKFFEASIKYGDIDQLKQEALKYLQEIK